MDARTADGVWHTRGVDDTELELALAAESPRVEWKLSDKNTEILEAVCALANDLEASGAWVRVGTVTRRANDADITRLNERRPENTRPFDLRVLPGATLDDLDVHELGSLHAAAKLEAGDPETFPDLEHWLRQRELIALREGVWRPNAAAMLLFGLSPQSFVPGAYVEIAQYRGDDYDSDVVSRKTVTGTVPSQLDSIWQDIASRIVETPTADEGMKTRYGPQYPVHALRELARNMLQHRLYDGTSAPARISWFYGNPPLQIDTDGFTTITVRSTS